MPKTPSPERLMPEAEPWRLEGDSETAFLICHGYRGSPFNVRPLGEFLHEKGHTAIGILLPGHGSTIHDMSRSRWYHWEEHLRKIYLEERSRYKNVFLIGFSMGGSLVMKLAADHAESLRPTGIITIAAPVFFNGFFNGKIILNYPSILLTGLFSKIINIIRLENRFYSVSSGINPWVGYSEFHSLAAFHSFKRALPKLRGILHKIHIPYCSITADNDRRVSKENQVYIFNHIKSREKRAYNFFLPPDFTTMHALLTHIHCRDRVFGYVKSFIDDILQTRSSSPRTSSTSTLDKKNRNISQNSPQKRSVWERLRKYLRIKNRRRVPEDMVYLTRKE